MADAARGRGGFGRGRGERGRGRRGPRRGGRKDEEKEWVPVTKLGRLVKDGKIKSMEEIYLFSLPVKEYQIIDFFLPKLKDEVMKIMPVQKQTRAGQRTRFKAFVAIGDSEGHVGLGVKCAKEVATAIRGAIILAKLSVIPVRRGYWGAALGEPHTVPSKVSGKVGSVMCRLIPAPRGTGIVAAPASKRLLQLAGVEDVYTQSKGSTATMGNFLKATFAAITKTYAFLTPDLWRDIPVSKFPYDEHSAHLQLAGKKRMRQTCSLNDCDCLSSWLPMTLLTLAIVYDLQGILVGKGDICLSMHLSGHLHAWLRPVSLCPLGIGPFEHGDDSLSAATPISIRRFSALPNTEDLLSNADSDCEETAGYMRRLLADHKPAFSAPRTLRTRGKLVEPADVLAGTAQGGRNCDTAPDSDCISDDDPSVYDLNVFDFPEPPPIGSPTIRRMRSSPWFLAACQADRNRNPSGRRWQSPTTDVLVQREQSLFPLPNDAAALLDSRREVPETVESNLLTVRSEPNVRRADVILPRAGLGLDVDMQSSSWSRTEATGPQSGVLSSSASLGYHNYGQRTDNLPAVKRSDLSLADMQPSRSLGPLPRIIRKVASMKSELHKGNLAEHEVSDMYNSRRTIPKARSFLRASNEDKDSTVRHPQNIWQRESHQSQDKLSHLEVTGPKNKTSRFSTFLATRGHSSSETKKATQSELADSYSSSKHLMAEGMTSKSFIDFTPDRSEAFRGGAKRERVRDFIARASIAVRSLGKKKKG
ncbi:hypothetical protein CVT26_013714 [Gymnopilus dilepis]|uniref:Small ribosomal subunit protein uS5 n=1 Tax=Gymnopilus dilepis TaxID=231916 RepID=A0A409YWP0_9AGAR|nr:hypothetical protein CVT26_013714 [Gymnopilus dilepis]